MVRIIRDARSSDSTCSPSTPRMKGVPADDDVGIIAKPPRSVALCLSLYDVEGLGEPLGFYYVVFSLVRDDELWSPVAEGQPGPQWTNCWSMTLWDYPWAGNVKLRVELLRASNKGKDPEPSTGMVVAGRVEIPLPRRLGKRKCGRFQLVRSEGDECQAKGTIGVGMELLPLEERGE